MITYRRVSIVRHDLKPHDKHISHCFINTIFIDHTKSLDLKDGASCLVTTFFVVSAISQDKHPKFNFLYLLFSLHYKHYKYCYQLE